MTPARNAALPGQAMISGTRIPPSVALNLYPDSGDAAALAQPGPIALKLPRRPILAVLRSYCMPRKSRLRRL